MEERDIIIEGYLQDVPLKTFQQKWDNLPLLEDYKEVLEDSYWNRWEQRERDEREGKVSWMDADKLDQKPRGSALEI